MKPRTVIADFLMLGAGVQSSTIVEMIVEGELPVPTGIIFSDTGNEPSWVYEQVEYLKTRVGELCQFAVVSNGHILNDLLALKRFASMPMYTLNTETGKRGILRRQCTNEYKIIPADSYIKDFLMAGGFGKINSKGARRVNAKYAVRHWYGISNDETFREAVGRAWRTNYYPLIEKKMSREDCVAWLQFKRLKVPNKSSCIVCPYHGDDYWFMLSVEAPLEFEVACCFDDSLRDPSSGYFFQQTHDLVFLHKSCKPLREINFALLQDKNYRDAFHIELVLSRPCGFNGGGKLLNIERLDRCNHEPPY